MTSGRFQNIILSGLLIALQLGLPSSAPWLHVALEGSGCARHTVTAGRRKCDSGHGRHCCHRHAHRKAAGDPSQGADPAPPAHDCSQCALCQVLAAPRTLTVLVEIPAAVEFVDVIDVADCVNPHLGFGLLPQCRAPPSTIACDRCLRCSDRCA